MNISTNKTAVETRGAFADGLTLVRVILTPIIMLVIIRGGWPSLDMAVLASILFAIAALTDLLDNMVGGGETSKARQLGWFDDIADTALITGTLAAMFWTLYASGYLQWAFAIPAALIIGRDVLVGLIKGRSFRKTGWPETRFGELKTAISMLAVCGLIAAPWLSNGLGRLVGSTDEFGIYTVPWISHIALGLLWLAAFLSLITGLMLLLGKNKAANDA